MPKPAITRVSNLQITPSSTNQEKGFYTAPITTAQRNAMTQNNGSFIYNSDIAAFQGLQNGTWNNVYTQSSLGFSLKRTAIGDIAYQILSTDMIVAITAITAARIITLPPIATTTPGQIFIVKKEANSASVATVQPTGGDGSTIDGNPTITLAAAYAVVRLYSNGTNWFSW